MPRNEFHPASFRDSAGFIFEREGRIYRQVNREYAEHYELLMNSGLYAELAQKNALITHTETEEIIADKSTWYKTLFPEQLDLITYPYEWCQDQLRDAALHTIDVSKTALNYGMILKDATPFNIQFTNGRPQLIDTLSFEKYDDSKPWVAYRQFCNMFLFPLYLAHYLKTDIQKILIAYPEGIPVEITSRLLPLKSNFSLGVWLHVHLQHSIAHSGKNKTVENFNRKKLLNLISHLENIINRLTARAVNSQWLDYYETSIMGQDYLAEKEKLFNILISGINPSTALDLGCNDGRFSYLLLKQGFKVIAVDSDSRSVGKLYSEMKGNSEKNLEALVVDVANPTPAIGFRNRERTAFHDRIKTELVVALALIHHLVIGRNISLSSLAAYFHDIAQALIIEWVPKEDEKVQQMLASRTSLFNDYTQTEFEAQFGRYFRIESTHAITGTLRSIYVMKKK